jgi:hypothetical protein
VVPIVKSWTRCRLKWALAAGRLPGSQSSFNITCVCIKFNTHQSG